MVRIKLEYDNFKEFSAELWPNLCDEGMWVPIEAPPELGVDVLFEVSLKDNFQLLRGKGEIVAHELAGRETKGMAIRFRELDGSSRTMLSKILRRHRARGGTPLVMPQVDGTPVGAERPPGASGEPFQLEGDLPGPPELPTEAVSGTSPLDQSTVLMDPSEVAAVPDETVPAPIGFGKVEPEPARQPGVEEVGLETGEVEVSEDVLSEAAPMDDAESEESEAGPDLESSILEATDSVEPLMTTQRIVVPPSGPILLDVDSSEPPETSSRRRLYAMTVGASALLGLLVFVLFGSQISAWFGGAEEASPPVEQQTAAARQDPQSEPAADQPTAGPEASGEAPASSDDGRESAGEAAASETPAERAAAATTTADSESAAADATPRPASSQPFTRVERITWERDAGATVVFIWLDGEVDSGRVRKFRVEQDSPREVVRISGIQAPVNPRDLEIGSAEVARIRTGLHRVASGSELHVVADLEDSRVRLVEIQPVRNAIRLRFSRR